MCRGCYEEYGSPVELCETTYLAVLAIKEVYKRNSVGGNLHVVIDDWNIGDDSIAFCLDPKNRMFRDNKAQIDAEQIAIRLLEGMTLEQRATALAIHDGYLDPVLPTPVNYGTYTVVEVSQDGSSLTIGEENDE